MWNQSIVSLIVSYLFLEQPKMFITVKKERFLLSKDFHFDRITSFLDIYCWISKFIFFISPFYTNCIEFWGSIQTVLLIQVLKTCRKAKNNASSYSTDFFLILIRENDTLWSHLPPLCLDCSISLRFLVCICNYLYLLLFYTIGLNFQLPLETINFFSLFCTCFSCLKWKKKTINLYKRIKELIVTDV